MSTFFVLVWDQLKNALRTKKAIIFLLLYLAVFSLIAYGFFQMQTLINNQIKTQGISGFQKDFLITFAKNALIAQANNNVIVEFLLKIPFINIALFGVSLFGTPVLLLILGYDKISQEVYDGTIRYVVFRAHRLTVFFSKYISSLIECALITLLALILTMIWAYFQVPDFHLSLSLSYGLRYWIISQAFLSVFIALSLMFSSFFRKPFTALITSIVSFFAFLILPVLANLLFYDPIGMDSPPLQFLQWFSPFNQEYFRGLFYYSSPELTFSICAYAIFTTIFLSIGAFVFNKKDL